MARFAPIAIVGRACLLPGADSPAALWARVRAGEDCTGSAPAGRWGVDPAALHCDADTPQPDRVWSDRGGYVTGFDFDPTGFAVEPARLQGLDPVFTWALHTARAALRDAKLSGTARTGAIFGSLGFPTRGMSAFAESVWGATGDEVDPRNRFGAGLPALLLARALELGAGATALDAACASSLYAIKFACDRLHDGAADVMLAGAVNCADDLFIHVGFGALRALSKTGRSRPFHAEADGLLPAEGAGFVVLKRLADARRDGDEIHGVIRGVGLSNDGRGRGFLVPSASGQARALQAAYAMAGLSPADVDYVECHATGTQLGDATELASLGEVFGDAVKGLPLGSLKANVGHLITAAGVAGLIKACEAMRAGELPPTPHVDTPADALAEHGVRVLGAPEPWPTRSGPRRAAVSAFGFGGNNAHLIVEAHDPSLPAEAASVQAEPVGIVAVAMRAGDCTDADMVLDTLAGRRSPVRDGAPLEVDPIAVGIPPHDLAQTLPQQLAMLDVASQAVAATSLEGARTGVFVGMGVDAGVARYGARWRHGEGFVDALTAAGVIGTMPNIPTNRVNRRFDFGGGSCSVFAEQRSGLDALALGARAVATGELDAAVIGAVDLAREPVQRAAAAALLRTDAAEPGDAAVALVLRRVADAQAAGLPVLAVLAEPDAAADEVWGPGSRADLTSMLGHAHAATGLLHVGALAWALHRRVDASGRPRPRPERVASVQIPAMEGARGQVSLRPGTTSATAPARTEPPVLAAYQGATKAAVADAVANDRRTPVGDLSSQGMRVVLVAASEAQLQVRRAKAQAHLHTGTPPGAGVHVRGEAVAGEVGFVFTSAGSAYAGAGLPLLHDLPELGDAVSTRFRALDEALSWTEGPAEAEQRLWSASAVCQLHAELSMRVLGLKPQAAIGYSSGESNSLFALGAWRDVDAMRDAARASALFTRNLAGGFETVKAQWGPDADWQMWSVLAPRAEVEALVAATDRVELAIVHSDADVVIGGEAAAIAPIVEAVGRSRCAPLAYNMCVHVPQLRPDAEAWLRLHRRTVHPVPGVRFYSGGRPDPYIPATEACAQTILGQAEHCLEVPPMIERAWADGVRVFVEHGPGRSCTRWITDILGPARLREAVVVALDKPGQGAIAALDAAAALVAAGVAVQVDALLARLTPPKAVAPTRPGIPVPLHLPAVRARKAPASTTELLDMKPAPALPPVLGPDFVVATHTSRSAEPAPPPAAAPIKPAAPPVPAAAPVVAAVAPPKPVSAASPAPIPAPVVLPTPGAGPAEAGARMLAEIGALHQRFVQQQAAVHARFLAGRTQLLAQSQGRVQPVAPAAVPPRSPAVARVSVPGVPPTPVTAPVATPAPAAAPPKPSSPAVTPTRTPASAKPAPTPTPTKPVAKTPVATKPTSAKPSAAPTPIGLTLSRAQLEVGASGRISEIFGPLFEQQDGYAKQVRMPEPPLLLADRVTGIDAEPGVLGTGTIWTETDVCADSWYLNRGRMPGGIFIESGQADLLLISWMGADFLNKGDRVYRLLGCTLTFGGDLPAPGETLQYDIHVDGHARHDDVRLFFFHYDCRIDGDIRLSVRNGQAGFFTEEELADSDGVLWSPEEADIVETPRLDPPAQLTDRRSFSRADIEAFADGRPWDCFGEGFSFSQTHSNTPRIQGGRMLFLDEVTHFEPEGGPWKRGYLRARTPVTPQDWFFDGHFKNDPCMPGTLMFEGCFQALSLYLSALGYTLRRDGWRFQPVPGEPIDMRCRGQVTPSSKETIYEVFVEEIIAGPMPTIYADLLCTVDGLKAFHAKRVGLQLVPDWPLESWTHLLENYVEPKPVAEVALPEGGTFKFDYASLLACAWGRPSDAFGPMYAPFDSHRTAPRLPSPPYHFMSRVTSVTGPIGVAKPGAEVVVEYDVPADAWYFDDNGAATMPFAVLLEAALQPCGWLASYVGSVLEYDNDLLFRNLDGTGTQLREVFRDAGTLRTEVKLTALSKAGGMVITSFDVEMFQGDAPVYTLKTVFGCFPVEAFEDQSGLPVEDRDRALLDAPGTEVIDLDARPEALYREGATLPGSKLDMLNRITGFWPEGGVDGLGAMRAEKDVRASDWYFKAHFFQDPVQPGSLGIEAMIQLLQAYMLCTGMDEGVTNPRFEPLATKRPMTWRYRGQVVPRNERVLCTLEITDRGRDDDGPFAIARASLWVDGLRIYSAEGLGMRIVSTPTPQGPRGGRPGSHTLEAARDGWLLDHCPTWNRPAVPMMSLVDLIAQAVDEPIAAIEDVAVHGWVDVAQPRTLQTVVERSAGPLRVKVLDDDGEPVATARVRTGAFEAAPTPWEALQGPAMTNPYEDGSLFHGPAFQLWTGGVRTGQGASTTLDAGRGSVPRGRLHPALLDAALHGIPHDALHLWSEAIGDDVVAYPARVPSLRVFGPTPTEGVVRCEVRFAGLLAPGLPRFELQLIVDGPEGPRVWADATVVEACFPKGPLGAAAPADRRRFLRDRAFVPGVRLSRTDGTSTRLRADEVKACDWMPGTVQGIYGRIEAADIAALEHVGHAHGIHPGRLPAALPLNPPALSVTREGDDVVVRDAGPAVLDPAPVRPFWARQVGHDDAWIGRDLWEGLLQQFVGRVVVEDPEDFATLRQRPAIYLANHQVQIESLLITHLLAGFSDRAVTTMANAKHQQRWIGWILRLLFGGDEGVDPAWILYFDQSKPQSMANHLAALEPKLRAGQTSFFLHPQGTRSQHAAESLRTVSSTILDYAVRLQLPIVPVRFTGGLPLEPIDGKAEFPVGYGAQDYWIGASIEAAEIAALPYAERAPRVVDAIEALGPAPAVERPAPADASFGAAVDAWRAQRNVGEVEAVFAEVLARLPNPSAQTRAVLDALRDGRSLPQALAGDPWRGLVERLG